MYTKTFFIDISSNEYSTIHHYYELFHGTDNVPTINYYPHCFMTTIVANKSLDRYWDKCIFLAKVFKEQKNRYSLFICYINIR